MKTLMLIASLIAPGNPAQAHPPIDVSPEIAKNTYAVSSFIMDIVRWLTSAVGLHSDSKLVNVLYAAVVFLISFGIGLLLQKVVTVIITALGKRLNSSLYHHMLDYHFFTKSCRIIPPIVFLVLIEFTMTGSMSHWLTVITFIYLLFVIGIAIVSLIDATWQHIDEKDNKRKLPLKGVVQLLKGVIWIIFAIIVLAMLLDKSPEKLLAGLGAFAAVLMLVFKDSILGVVAGVQLSENDTLHVGDWIKVHGTEANGSVAEVTLTAVKILNWDKTVTTVPPYTLISTGFTNYRNMQESQTRRIQRSYYIDADSVTLLTEEMLQSLRKLPFMADYIDKKRILRDAAGEGGPMPKFEGLVDGTIETNLGLFRAYFQMYLAANSNISHEDTCFVTTLEQTSCGIPLQVYCFTTTSAWVKYEAIQAAVFEHLSVMLHCFGLCCFESPSGRDTILEGYLPAAGIDRAFGVPYPFLNTPDVLVNPIAAERELAVARRNADAAKSSPTPQSEPAAAKPSQTPRPSGDEPSQTPKPSGDASSGKADKS